MAASDFSFFDLSQNGAFDTAFNTPSTETGIAGAGPLYDPNYDGPDTTSVNPDYFADSGTGAIYWVENGVKQYTGDTIPWTTPNDGSTISLGTDPNNPIAAGNLDPTNKAQNQGFLSSLFSGLGKALTGSGSGSPGGSGGSMFGGSSSAKPAAAGTQTAQKPVFSFKLPSGQTVGITSTMLIIGAVILYFFWKGK